MTPELLESFRDTRTTGSLLQGILHRGTWEGRSDECSDFWLSSRNYQFYAGLAACLKPTSILELGVRMGYSLISLIRGCSSIDRMIGIDLEHAFKSSQRLAEENIRQVGYLGRLTLPKADRQWITENQVEQVDLIHVDAGHTAKDVENDILASWPVLRPGGVLIADDTDFIPELRMGIKSASEKIGDIQTAFYFPTFRGWWVAKKATTVDR